jgi:hypothetical protein
VGIRPMLTRAMGLANLFVLVPSTRCSRDRRSGAADAGTLQDGNNGVPTVVASIAERNTVVSSSDL